MAKDYSGLAKVSYSDTQGGAKTDVTGKIANAGNLDNPNIKNETSDGQAFGGGQVTGEIHVLNSADYDTLEGFMEADTAKFWHFTYKDGRVLSTAEAINIFVRRGTGINARDGVTPMIIDFDQVGPQVMLEDTTA